jgi:outer membrane protein OmpA-like peptidoglycan-associated protein
MNRQNLFIASGILFICGVALCAYVYRTILPKTIHMQAATQQPVSIRDTVTFIRIDTVALRRRDSLVVSVYFQPGDASMSGIEQQRLEHSLKSIGEYRKRVFVLDGYADPTGAAVVDNNFLASRRGFTLYNYLIRCGVGKNRIYMRSFGSLIDSSKSIDSVRKVDVSLSEVFDR